jgi:hypothetical protein
LKNSSALSAEAGAAGCRPLRTAANPAAATVWTLIMALALPVLALVFRL